jgi:hypothetical protein
MNGEFYGKYGPGPNRNYNKDGSDATQARIRLEIAAPELIAALKAMLSLHDYNTGDYRKAGVAITAREKALNAIARAEGIKP